MRIADPRDMAGRPLALAADLQALAARVAALEGALSGTVTVTYQGTPPSGAAWSADGGASWHDFGDPVSVPAGTVTITYKAVSKYTAPASQQQTVTIGGSHTVQAGAYTPNNGTLAVTFTGTVPTGAGFSVNGSSYSAGQPASVPPGTYTVTFADAAGYDKPAAQSGVVIASEETTTITAEYTEKAAGISGPRVVVVNSSGYDGIYTIYSGSYDSTAAVYKHVSSEHYVRLDPNDEYAGWWVYSAASAGTKLKQIARNYGGSTQYSASAGANTVFDGGHTYNGVTTFYGDGDLPVNGITLQGFSTAAYNGPYTALGGDAKLTYMNYDASSYGQVVLRVPIYTNGTAYLYPTTYMGESTMWSVNTSPAASDLTCGNGRTLASLVGSRTWSSMYGGSQETVTGTYTATGGGPHLLCAGNGVYAGDYYLYSGDKSANDAVWKEETYDLYIVHDINTSYTPWVISTTALASDKKTQIANNYYGVPSGYSKAAGADTVFAGGHTYNGYTTTYYAS